MHFTSIFVLFVLTTFVKSAPTPPTLDAQTLLKNAQEAQQFNAQFQSANNTAATSPCNSKPTFTFYFEKEGGLLKVSFRWRYYMCRSCYCYLCKRTIRHFEWSMSNNSTMFRTSISYNQWHSMSNLCPGEIII